jgi:hypothetical protein
MTLCIAFILLHQIGAGPLSYVLVAFLWILHVLVHRAR